LCALATLNNNLTSRNPPSFHTPLFRRPVADSDSEDEKPKKAAPAPAPAAKKAAAADSSDDDVPVKKAAPAAAPAKKCVLLDSTCRP
jgi:hypothetical protein